MHPMLSELVAWKDADDTVTIHLTNGLSIEGTVVRVLENDGTVYIRSIYGDTNYVIVISSIVCFSWQGALE